MNRKWVVLTAVLIGMLLVILPLAGVGGAPLADGPSLEEVRAAIAKGVEWLANQQDPNGYWGTWERCAVTGMAVKKLEHFAVDAKYGLGLQSPFDPEYPYREHVQAGLNWLIGNCAATIDISAGSPHGDPDTDGDGLGVIFGTSFSSTYTSGIALMTLCEAVELDRTVPSGPLMGWTFEDVARDTMDYLAFGQNDTGNHQGGWGYYENYTGGSDQSNSGYAALGLGFAEAAPPSM
ncbi:MAG: hypothetical protein PVI78_08455 [Anaerolineales bacterium]|jgi:hypothetical protein